MSLKVISFEQDDGTCKDRYGRVIGTTYALLLSLIVVNTMTFWPFSLSNTLLLLLLLLGLNPKAISTLRRAQWAVLMRPIGANYWRTKSLTRMMCK